jgi:hypothetical protein
MRVIVPRAPLPLPLPVERALVDPLDCWLAVEPPLLD